MDEKAKNDSKRVMLVQQAKDGKLKAVTNVEQDGSLQTTDPTQANMANLLNVNTFDSPIEAFFKKLMEQAETPSHTGIFIMTEQLLNKLIKIDLDPEVLENYRIDPAAELQNRQQGDVSQFQPMDVTKIDLDDLARKGIRQEDMEPFLKAMSYGHKSNKLVDMNPEMEPGGVRVSTKGRISLSEQPDGTLRVIPHYWQDKPNLDAPLYGTLLDQEAKTNLLNTSHAGKIVNLELTPGVIEPCFVSLDKLTNTMQVQPVSQLVPITKIKGADLSPEQQADFAAGRNVLVEGMYSRNGYKFDAYIQFNASDNKVDFTYEGLDRKRYYQDNREARQAAWQESGVSRGNIFIPKRLLGVELDQNQTKSLEAGNATYVKGMMTTGSSKAFDAWVKPNYENGKLSFYKWNPDRTKQQAAKQETTHRQEPPAAKQTPAKPRVKKNAGQKI